MSEEAFECPEIDFSFSQDACGAPLAVGGGVGCAVALAVGALLSLGAVPPLYYGIRYNTYNKYADVENVFGPGRHFIWPLNVFVLYPALAQNVEFSDQVQFPSSGRRYPALHTRTKEGLALNLEVSLQYKLKRKEVGQLYAEFNVFYEDMFISTIRDTIIKAAAEYNAYQLWDQRKEVGDKMQELVNISLSRTYAECWGLQLLDIALPGAFDSSIVATQVQNQAVTTEQFAQAAALIHAETEVIESEYERRVKVTTQEGQANYTLVTKTAKAKAKQMILDMEAEVLENIKESLKLQKQDLIMYQKYSAVQLMSNASLYYGFGKGSQVLLSRQQQQLPSTPQPSPTQAAHLPQAQVQGQAAATPSPAYRLLKVDEL